VQDWLCGICGITLKDKPMRDICLDHDHKTGYVRKVLCRNCNGIEGKIFKLANRGKRTGTQVDFLLKIVQYWEAHKDAHDGLIHPKHKNTAKKDGKKK
jgi:hypothetical protein